MLVIADCVSVGMVGIVVGNRGEDVTITSLINVSGGGRRQRMNGIASTFVEKAHSSWDGVVKCSYSFHKRSKRPHLLRLSYTPDNTELH
jgi:hypothetical protein